MAAWWRARGDQLGEKGESQIGDPRDGPLMRWKGLIIEAGIHHCLLWRCPARSWWRG